jgi:hypothetical protein
VVNGSEDGSTKWKSKVPAAVFSRHLFLEKHSRADVVARFSIVFFFAPTEKSMRDDLTTSC